MSSEPADTLVDSDYYFFLIVLPLFAYVMLFLLSTLLGAVCDYRINHACNNLENKCVMDVPKELWTVGKLRKVYFLVCSTWQNKKMRY